MCMCECTCIHAVIKHAAGMKCVPDSSRMAQCYEEVCDGRYAPM